MVNEKQDNGGLSIFEYLDYRIFLNDYYEYKKSTDHLFSYRSFAKIAEVSASLFKDILSGRQNLSEAIAKKYAKAMKLKKKEEEYLIQLLRFNNSSVNSEKNHYFDALMLIRRQRNSMLLEVGQYEYFSCWYHSVIRELINGQKIDCNLEELSQKITPLLTVAKLKKSIALLLELGLIEIVEKSGVKVYLQKDQSISSGFEVQSQAVKKYQQEMLKLAAESIDRFTAKERNLQAMTLSGSKEAFEKIKALMNQFVNETFNILEADQKKPEKVCALNLQLFPLASMEDNREGEHEN